MLLLSDELISQEITLSMVIEWVEEAFAADARGHATTFPAIVQHVGLAHAHLGIKSGYLRLEGASGAREVIGLKAGGYWSHNLEKHAPEGRRREVPPLCEQGTGGGTRPLERAVVARDTERHLGRFRLDAQVVQQRQ